MREFNRSKYINQAYYSESYFWTLLPFVCKNVIYGLPPHNNVVRPTAADLELLLSTNDVEPPKQLEEMDEATQRQLAELNTGSVALVYETEGGQGKQYRVILAV